MEHFSLIDTPYDTIFPKIITAIDTENDATYIFDYRSDFSNSKILRDFVGALFDAFAIPTLWRGRFILITDELINNSIEHGSNNGDINRCIISTKKHNGLFHISVEVHDTGKKHTITATQDILEKKKNDIENHQNNESDIYMGKRGRGLFHITEKIVDKLIFGESEKGGLMVKIEKCINTNNESCNDTQKTSENGQNEESTKK